MLLSRDAIDSTIALLVPEDFYKPAHLNLFDAITHLHAHGEPVDVTTVDTELTRRGILDTLGGRAELFRLQKGTPASANASSYARTVQRMATRRKLIAAAGQISEAAYDLGVEEEALVVLAQERIRDADLVTGGRPAQTMDEFIAETPGIEWIVENMIARLDRCLIVSKEGGGKLLALDTPVVTPAGFTPIGEVRRGDAVFDRHGQPCTVVAVSDVQIPERAWRIRFDSGEEFVACGDHEWLTADFRARQPQHRGDSPAKLTRRTTDEIAATLHARRGHTVNHSIPCASPLELPDVDLPVPPYTLGVWLGDGSTAEAGLTLGERDAEPIVARITAEGVRTRTRPSERRPTVRAVGMLGMLPSLRAAGVLCDKHIPSVYLRASKAQRLALLQGLMDTDGTVSSNGRRNGRGYGSSPCELLFTNERLTEDARALVLSLGIKANRIVKGRAAIYGVDKGPKFRFTFQTELLVATVPFKADRLVPLRTPRATQRYIVSVEPVAPVPMRCLFVDSPDHTFLIGESLIATHNTTLLRQVGVQVSQGIHPWKMFGVPPMDVLMVDCENPPTLARAQFRALRQIAQDQVGAAYDPSRMRVVMRPEGLDLTSRADALWLYDLLEANRPDLLCIGPAYKLHEAEEEKSSDVRQVLKVLDRIRTRYECAIWLETHAPHESFRKGAKLRPAGSRLWLRWPEFVVTLEPRSAREDEDVWYLGHARTPRDSRPWPHQLLRGLSRAEADPLDGLDPAPRWPWRAVA